MTFKSCGAPPVPVRRSTDIDLIFSARSLAEAPPTDEGEATAATTLLVAPELQFFVTEAL